MLIPNLIQSNKLQLSLPFHNNDARYNNTSVQKENKKINSRRNTRCKKKRTKWNLDYIKLDKMANIRMSGGYRLHGLLYLSLLYFSFPAMQRYQRGSVRCWLTRINTLGKQVFWKCNRWRMMGTKRLAKWNLCLSLSLSLRNSSEKREREKEISGLLFHPNCFRQQNISKWINDSLSFAVKLVFRSNEQIHVIFSLNIDLISRENG